MIAAQAVGGTMTNIRVTDQLSNQLEESAALNRMSVKEYVRWAFRLAEENDIRAFRQITRATDRFWEKHQDVPKDEGGAPVCECNPGTRVCKYRKLATEGL